MSVPVLYYGDPINRSHPCMRGIVSRWKVVPWYASGPRFIDLASRNHGTLTSGAKFDGAFGRSGGFGALSLDGTDDYLRGTTANNPLLSDIASGMWFRTSTGTGTLFGRRSVSGDQFAGITIDIGATTTGKLSIYFRGLDGTNTRSAESASTYHDGRWHYAVGVWQRSGNATVYVDGASAASVSISSRSADSLNLTEPWVAGCTTTVDSFPNGTGFFTGQLDDWHLFLRNVSASEVRQLYDATSRRDDPTLNWIRPVTYFAPAAIVGGTILPQMIQQGLYAGSAA